MNVVLNRVDERLIHGQVLVSWAQKLQVRRILVVDDQLVYDELTKTVLTMSVPASIELKLMDVSHAVDYLRTNQDGTLPNTIVLARTPQVFKRLQEGGYQLTTLNIGGMAAGASRRHLCRGIYASQEEIAILQEFRRQGVDVYVQIVFAETPQRIDFQQIADV